MTTSDAVEKGPLWLLIEENILELDSQDLSGENLEASIQRIAGELDNAGYNVSHHGGNMLQLRWAMNRAQGYSPRLTTREAFFAFRRLSSFSNLLFDNFCR